jgi:hypothetical protein
LTAATGGSFDALGLLPPPPPHAATAILETITKSNLADFNLFLPNHFINIHKNFNHAFFIIRFLQENRYDATLKIPEQKHFAAE